MKSVKSLIKESVVWKKYRPIIKEKHILASERKKFLSEAKIQFESNPEHGNCKDYVDAFKKHRVTYGEYMHKFEYWKLNEAQRDEFISCSEMQCIYRKMVQPEIKTVFWNKILFLKKFHRI